jgi:hypothetical protein
MLCRELGAEGLAAQLRGIATLPDLRRHLQQLRDSGELGRMASAANAATPPPRPGQALQPVQHPQQAQQGQQGQKGQQQGQPQLGSRGAALQQHQEQQVAAGVGPAPPPAAAEAGGLPPSPGNQPAPAPAPPSAQLHARLAAWTDEGGRPAGRGPRAGCQGASRQWTLLTCKSAEQKEAAKRLSRAWRCVHCPSSNRWVAEADEQLLRDIER